MTGLASTSSDTSITRETRDYEITTALQLLNEVKDILDELNIIQTVLTAQGSVMDEAFKCLAGLSEDDSEQAQESFDGVPELIGFYQSYSKIGTMFREVRKLNGDAGEIAMNVGAS